MSKNNEYSQLRVDSIGAWGKWLEKNGKSEEVIWLVFKKKGAGPVPFGYHEAVEEALCHGWVDSLLKSIDDKEYMRKFTPRKPTSTWSELNKTKVEKLLKEGRMKPTGMKTVEVAKENGMWDKGIKPPEVDDSLPGALLQALQSSPKARENYFNLPAKSQKQYNIWINMAKRVETIHKRIEESVRLLEEGKELGLK